MADQRSSKVNKLLAEADTARIELSCFRMLSEQETAAIVRRLKDAEATAAMEAEVEELLQACAENMNLFDFRVARIYQH